MLSTMKSELLFELEKEIAGLLLEKLEKMEITPERASRISKFVLSFLPENLTDEQVKNLIPKLDDQFFELSGIVLNHTKDYEKDKGEAVKEIEGLLKQGEINEAQKLMTNYLQTKRIVNTK